MVSIGLSILSWRGAEALRPSLESYARAALFDEFTEAQLFLPDPDAAVMKVADDFDLTVKTVPQNLGIMENMAAAARAMSTDYILMLENDCPLIEPLDEVQMQIATSLELLARPDVIMARLRSIGEPGQAFSGLAKYRKLFDDSLSSRLLRLLRPDKVRRLAGYALYDDLTSINRHPGYFQEMKDRFFLVDAAVMPWTNQSILVHRETFLSEIIPLTRSVKTKRHANNFPNLEVELNKSKAWRNSGWKIACGPGLFTHERIGDRGYT